MPGEGAHHTSRKRGYTFLIVPNDDVAGPKSLKLTLWEAIGAFSGSVGLIVLIVLALLFFTPVGRWVNIPNPELEIRYTQELVSLNQKMASLMEQLIELRSYNVKLRNALGEKAVATDSGVVVTRTTRQSDGEGKKSSDAGRTFGESYTTIASTASYPLPLQRVSEGIQTVAFPAVLPSEGYITRGYAPEERHFGLDIAGKVGTPVTAAADGYVVFAGWTNDDGNVVILSHTNGFLTFYKHNQTLLKNANSFVKRGEPIALLGNSGRTSSGPHLHFEIWKDGAPVNPASFLINLNL